MLAPPTPARTRGFAAVLFFAATMIASACAVPSPEDDTAAVRAQASAVGPAVLPPVPVPVAPARPLEPVAITLAAVDVASAADAEDGAGRLTSAVAAVAIDVTASDPWPARALDPVLHVGPLHFHRYRYVDPRTLRFVVADRAALPVGADPYVQYGPDERSRVVMARAWVPR